MSIYRNFKREKERREYLKKCDYLLLGNRDTGEECVVDLKEARYKKMCKGFLNSVKLFPRFCKHLILTQAKESYHPKILNNFFNEMRRWYGDIVYIWSVEVQEERKEKTGETVLHWHIILGFDWFIDFGRDDILRIQRYWKYGIARVKPVYNLSTGYLMKYITKALDAELEGLYQIRRMSTSRIAGWLKQSWKRIWEAYEFFKKVGFETGLDALDCFWWRNGNAYLYEYEDFMGVKLRRSILVYRKESYGWFVKWGYQGEAF